MIMMYQEHVSTHSEIDKSTVDAILERSEEIVENLEDKCGSVCTLIDHTRAFDSLSQNLTGKKRIIIQFTM